VPKEFFTALPGLLLFAHDGPVTGKRVLLQLIQIRNQSCPQRIQVNISHQLEKIGLFLTQYGFIAVLKKVAAALMSSIVPHGMTGQESPHHGGNRDWAGSLS